MFGQAGGGLQWRVSLLAQEVNWLNKLNQYEKQLEQIINEISLIEKSIYAGYEKRQSVNQLLEIVQPEFQELYEHAIKGEVFYKYGKKQRMLASTYCITESMMDLESTKLGQQIILLQELYDRL